jgi:hypothetical protein
MSATFTITCPCCRAELQVDPQLAQVLTFQEAERPREVADIDEAMTRFKGEKDKRESLFAKSVEAEKNKKSLLDRKFEELLKQAQSSPADEPPKRDLDWD